MASERCKKILKNVRLRRRLRFDIEPNSADCEQDENVVADQSNIIIEETNNQDIGHNNYFNQYSSIKPLSPTIIINKDCTQDDDCDYIENSDTEKTYETFNNIEISSQINIDLIDAVTVQAFDEVTSFEAENIMTQVDEPGVAENIVTQVDKPGVAENIVTQVDEPGNAEKDTPAKKPRTKNIAKKSYIDYLSDDGDFQWSSSSWVASSNEEHSEEERSRKKQKTCNLEDGKVGDNGFKKKKKINNRKERKRLRNEGQEYTKKDGSIVRAKVMKPHPCLNKKCGRSCDQINDERRQSLFNFFHSLTAERKRDWLVSNSQLEDTKRKRSKEQFSRRQNSFFYFINEGEGRRQVCQKFLIATLDITQRYLYYTLTNAQYKLSKTDMRGKHIPPNKTSAQAKDSVIQYIKNLPAVPSHYCRKDSTRLYLPQEFKNLSNLYQLYKKDFSSNGKDYVGERVFRNIFTHEFNISFHVPKKDKCLKCVSFKNNPDGFTSEEKAAHEKEVEDSKTRFKFHQETSKEDSQTLCVSFDLQKVLNTPYGESMLFYYSRKYSVYNFTLFESQTKEVFCYSWGEADAKRGGNEIATILFNYIKIVDQRKTVRYLLLYSDSCCGQNRNKIVFAAVHTALQSCEFIENIQMNFLIPGHTSMPVDSVHAVIERSVENLVVYAPSQWGTIFELARKNPKPYNVEIMCHQDFKAWDSMSEKYFKNNLVGKISKLRIVTFKKKDLDNIYIKYSMNDTAATEKVEVIGKNRRPGDNLYKNRLPIPKQKYADLVKLCKTFAIPRRYHEEYLNLQTCNAKELLPDTDIEDVDD